MENDKPYIGITGFTDPKEVSSVLAAFPNQIDRKLMIGVLASWKSIRGQTLKLYWQQKTPAPSKFSTLFSDNPHALNLIHYNIGQDYGDSSILSDMLVIRDLAGVHFHGFQLNITWPEIRQIDEYRMAVGYDDRIVLQIGENAFEQVGGTPKAVADMLYHYAGVINDILLDRSGGNSIPLDLESTRTYLAEIRDRGWNLGLGVAGGLGPDSLHLAESLLEEFPDLNIDAEGKLRNQNNELDITRVKAYLEKAATLLK